MEERTAGVKQALFGAFDFEAAAADRDFNEAQVRAVITDPMIEGLGYTQETILRDKALQSAFLRTGSKKRKVNLIPDYVLKVGGSAAWVLDAKAPWQQILDNGNIAQAYSYAAHPEIRSVYFALCNGLEFACWRTAAGDEQPALHFPMSGIDGYWEALRGLLSPESFQEGKQFEYEKTARRGRAGKAAAFDYAGRPLLGAIPARKRSCKRHFGVHGYFTRQSWNVVAAYIKNFSQEGDVVLDPFGGSGVTAVEALVNGRKAVSVDINPLAVFIVRALLAPAPLTALTSAYQRVKKAYQAEEPGTAAGVETLLKKYPGPKNLPLPKGSDVETAPELFSKQQAAQLALLKHLILREKDKNIRVSLLLMFSGLLTKKNLTYHTSTIAAKDGQGDASAMRYFRYRTAPSPIDIDTIKYLDLRHEKVKAAKEEIETLCLLNGKTAAEMSADGRIVKGSATDLSFLETESIDYIYTDPPYGKNIPYLDLSAMWLAWLDLDVSEQDYELEAIEGGSREKSREAYKTLMAKSIQEMYRVLKFDRWLSFVFAHKDPEFWHLILDTAEKCGFEYAGAVPQRNGQTSFKKRQRPLTVLSGQLILNFRKTKTPRALLKGVFGETIEAIIMRTIEGVIAKEHGAALEQINDELIIKGLEQGFLHLLKKHYSDLTPLLLENFDYDRESARFHIKKNKAFATRIDVKLRIKYFLTSYLRGAETADFDTIFAEIMPLLRNGSSPADQTILSVLKDIGEKTGQGAWRLKIRGEEGQMELRPAPAPG